MKRVTLREDRAPYVVDEEILSGEPVIVERNGQAVAAVIPMADYEAFLAWRAAAHAGGRPGGAGGGGTDQDYVF
jgi:PHD/YefM family antitoxin component YafN of YafNO toxin-antitoxin module